MLLLEFIKKHLPCEKDVIWSLSLGIPIVPDAHKVIHAITTENVSLVVFSFVLADWKEDFRGKSMRDIVDLSSELILDLIVSVIILVLLRNAQHSS
jgi:hypothetical protein